MADVSVELVAIEDVEVHPNADRLEVARVAGTQVVVPKDAFFPGLMVFYFPPGLLLPESVSNAFGVTKYLKHAEYPGDGGHSQCRVAGARLRGVPSFGFVVETSAAMKAAICESASWSETFGAVKYEPKPRVDAGEAEPDNDLFHRYTEIEYLRRMRDRFNGQRVVITEKIHGTNCRVGLVNGEWMAGSHKIRRKQSDSCMYWEPLKHLGVRSLLTDLAGDGSRFKSAILFGEIYGPGVQDMDYGVPRGQRHFRVFDISVDGSYVTWSELLRLCNKYALLPVPVLGEVYYEDGCIDNDIDGKTFLGEHSGKFKGREGIVIRVNYDGMHAIEPFDTAGRLIAKVTSADCLDRQDATDDE